MTPFEVAYSRSVARWAVISSRLDPGTWGAIRAEYQKAMDSGL